MLGGLFDSEGTEKTSSRLIGWPAAMPGIGEATGLVSRWVDEPLSYFPGQTYAPQTEAERQQIAALQAGADAYPGMLGEYLDPVTAAYQSALQSPQAALGMGLQNVMGNPALNAAAEAIQSQVNRNLSENILPQLTASSVAFGGAPGGTRQGVGEGLASRGTSEVLSEALANMYGNAWARGLGAETSRYLGGLQAQSSAMNMAPGLANLAMSEYTTPAGLYGQAGGLERSEEQRAIDEEMARFRFEQMEPLLRGQTGLNLLMTPAVQFGETQTEREIEQSLSPFQQIGGVLSGLGALAGPLASGFGMLGPAAGAATAAGGAYYPPTSPGYAASQGYFGLLPY